MLSLTPSVGVKALAVEISKTIKGSGSKERGRKPCTSMNTSKVEPKNVFKLNKHYKQYLNSGKNSTAEVNLTKDRATSGSVTKAKSPAKIKQTKKKNPHREKINSRVEAQFKFKDFARSTLPINSNILSTKNKLTTYLQSVVSPTVVARRIAKGTLLNFDKKLSKYI